MKRHAKAIVAISALLLTLVLGVTLANAVAPVVSVESASDVAYTTATVKGTVDPQGQSTTYRFQYATQAQFEAEGFADATTGIESSLEGTGAQPVEGELSSLSPNTTYHLRLVAENGDGQSESIAASTFTTLAIGPPSVTIDPVTTFTGTFSGTIDPEAPVGNPSEFDVDWHFECTPGCPGLGGGTIPADSNQHEVEADATGLEPNTDYEVKLVAENDGGPVSAGPEQFKTGNVAPLVQTLYAGSLQTDSAVLAANVNPRNADTTYQFEWGTDDSYGNVAPASPQSVGSEDNAFHVVTAPVSGLQPGTDYHFRVVATNVATGASAAGEDHAFTTLGPVPAPPSCANETLRVQNESTRLPDCRAYEQVSPVDKLGNNATDPDNSSFVFSRAATAGDRVAFASATVITPDAESAPGLIQNLSTRSPTGWTTESVDPPTGPAPNNGGAPEYDLLAPDLSAGVVAAYEPINPGDPSNRWNYYIRDFDTGEYQLISTSEVPLAPVPSSFWFFGSARIATPDFQHIVFTTNRRLTLDTPQETSLADTGTNVYEWNNGQLRYLPYLPDSDGPGPLQAEPAAAGGFIGGAPLGSGGSAYPAANAISADGSRVFYTLKIPDSDPLCGGSPSCEEVYLREGDEITTISTSQRSLPDPLGRGGKQMELASTDGSVAFIRSGEKLTDDATSGGPTGEGRFDDLYRYDVDSGELTDVTTQDPNGAGVLGTVGASDDADRVYFAAKGVLAPGAIDGKANLYLWEQGTGVRFIAALVVAGPNDDELDGRVWTDRRKGAIASREARVSRNGQILVFSSQARITSYDNDGLPQIYRFDASSPAGQALVCVSCNPAAGEATAGASLRHDLGNSKFPLWLRGNLSVDGRRVFFDTAEALVPQDSNGRHDVYVWQDGRARLISSGRSGDGARLLDASASGDDVFLATSEGLVPSDTDGLVDVYDARGGGGFPQPISSPACEGDACLPPPIVPNDPTPGSASHVGPGDPSSARGGSCRKPKKLRKGRCVKPRKAKKHKKARSRAANENRRTSR